MVFKPGSDSREVISFLENGYFLLYPKKFYGIFARKILIKKEFSWKLIIFFGLTEKMTHR
jgi:hypothetical protein